MCGAWGAPPRSHAWNDLCIPGVHLPWPTGEFHHVSFSNCPTKFYYKPDSFFKLWTLLWGIITCLDTSTFPLLPVLGCFLKYVLWCIFGGLSCHTENICKCTHGVWEEKKGSVLSHPLLPLPPSPNFLEFPPCEVKSWKKGKKVEKTLCDFCLLHSVLFSSVCSDSRDLSSYSLQSFVCLSLQMFPKNLFMSQGKITAH